MASTYSKLKIELIGTGDQAGQWGTTTNNNLGSSSAGVYRGLEQAIVGMATISSGFVANSYTLPYTNSNDDQEFRCLVLNITASLSNPSDLIVPAIQKPYIVINSSGQTVTVKVSGQTGVAVPNGAKILLYNTGTDVGTAVTYLTELKLGGNLTMPSAGSINDSNGNELIKFPSAVASAVNELTISNAATGSAPTLSATGGDTNIGITLTPKGTGTFLVTGNTTFTPTARTSGAASYFTVTTPADTGQTASTEVIGANYTAATRQWSTGALTLQRERVFAAPTYSFVGASTLTTAVNVDIATPVQGTNATITNAYALRAGASYFTGTVVADGNVTLNGGTANGVLYLNGSKVATSGSALTFDGTTLSVVGTSRSTTITGNIIEMTRAGVNYLISSNAASSWEFRGPSYAWMTADGASQRMTLDSSGNLGLGVTPSAWASSGRALDVLSAGTFAFTNSFGTIVAFNAFHNGTNWIYKLTAPAKAFVQDSANQYWLTAPSGTANTTTITSGVSYTIITSGNQTSFGAANNNVGTVFTATSSGALSSGTVSQNITFTQAMTLDASGNLGVGTPSPTGRLHLYGSDTAFRIQSSVSGNMQMGQWDGSTNMIQSSARNFRLLTTDAYPITFSTNSTEAARITSGGDFFIGNGETAASPSAGILSATGGTGTNIAGANLTIRGGASTGTGAGGVIIFSTAAAGGTSGTATNSASERARITSGGYFKASNDGTYVNSTGTYHELRQTANSTGVYITATNASYASDLLYTVASRNTTNNSFYYFSCYNDGALNFRLRIADSGNVTNTNGSYGTISDAKMKTDIVDAGSQWADIKAIRFRKFKMKDDPSGLLQLGVVAQELEQTSPGLVDEHVDRDAEGNDLGTTTKSVKTSILLMKAAKALQEAMTRIETLEAKVAALEGTQP